MNHAGPAPGVQTAPLDPLQPALPAITPSNKASPPRAGLPLITLLQTESPAFGRIHTPRKTVVPSASSPPAREMAGLGTNPALVAGPDPSRIKPTEIGSLVAGAAFHRSAPVRRRGSVTVGLASPPARNASGYGP